MMWLFGGVRSIISSFALVELHLKQFYVLFKLLSIAYSYLASSLTLYPDSFSGARSMFEVVMIIHPVSTGIYVAKTLVPDLSLEQVFRLMGLFAIMGLITAAILIAFPL